MNPFHKDFFFEVDFNTLLPSTLWSSKFSLSFMNYHQKTVWNSLLAMRAICPANLIFLHTNNILREAVGRNSTPDLRLLKPNILQTTEAVTYHLVGLSCLWRFILQYSGLLHVPDCTVSSLRRPYSRWCQNPLTPSVKYSGRTAPLTSKVAFYIFIQQI